MSSIRERKPISQLSDQEWTDYINILKMTRTNNSGYFVFAEEQSAGNSRPSTLIENVPLYNLFVWQHHYVAKDSEKSKCIDYSDACSLGLSVW